MPESQINSLQSNPAPAYNPIEMGDCKLEYSTKKGTERWIVWYSYPDPYTGQKRQWKIRKIKSGKIWFPLSSEEMAGNVLRIINHQIRDEQKEHNPWHWQPKTASTLSFSIQADLYLAHVNDRAKKKFIKPRQRDKIRYYFDNHFTPFFQDRDVTEIKGVHLDALVAELPDEWKVKTLNNVMSLLKTFFKRLVPDILPAIPKWPDLPKVFKKKPKWAKWEALKLAIDEIPEIDRDIFSIGCANGLRPGEAAALRVKDIDLDHGQLGQITIQGAFSDDEYYDEPKDGDARTIPINPESRPAFERIMKTKVGAETPLFINWKTGKEYKSKRLWNIWTKAARKVGLDLDVRRAMRTSWVMRMANAGKNMAAVRHNLGHASDETTRVYYEMQSESVGIELYGEDNVVELASMKKQ